MPLINDEWTPEQKEATRREVLLRCPFCGGDPMRYRNNRYVCCSDDECAGWMLRATAEHWNRRALAASQPAPADALHGPYGYLIMPEGLAEDEWYLADDPRADAASEPLYAKREIPLGKPAPAADTGQAVNVEAIAKVISLSYGENPEDDAPLGKICGPNNEPLPNWEAYREQAAAVFVWMMAVIDALEKPAPSADTGQAVAYQEAWEQGRLVGRAAALVEARTDHPAPLDAERVREAVHEAAIEWCGSKDRETSSVDVIYFQDNWKALPGLRAYVERAIGRAALRHKGCEA